MTRAGREIRSVFQNSYPAELVFSSKHSSRDECLLEGVNAKRRAAGKQYTPVKGETDIENGSSEI
jgi:hypothetical protein